MCYSCFSVNRSQRTLRTLVYLIDPIAKPKLLDIWTTPISSISGICYYVLFLDDYSNFLWVYPLRYKSEVFSKFLHFSSYVKIQFNSIIKIFQCDNIGEYANAQFQKYFEANGIVFRFSCSDTSQQNGKSERMIWTISNIIRALMFQAKVPPSYWVEALPSSTIQNKTPFAVLFNKQPHMIIWEYLGAFVFQTSTIPLFTNCLLVQHHASSLDTRHKIEDTAVKIFTLIKS